MHPRLRVGGRPPREAGERAGNRTPAALIGMAPVAAVIGALVLLLTRYSMWRDEAYTARLMTKSFGDLLDTLRSATTSEAAQPLYFVLLWPWARLFGTSEIALRLPSLAASVATAWVLESVLRRLGVGLRARGAWYVLLLPVMIWYSLEARPYALIVLLVSLHLLESARVLNGDSPTAVRLAVLTLLVTAAYSVAGCAAILAFCLVLWRRRGSGPDGATEAVVHRMMEGSAIAGSLLLVLFSVGKSSASAVPQGRSRPLSLAYAGYELVTGRSIGLSVGELRAGSLTALVGDHKLQVILLVVVCGVLGLLAWRGLGRLGRPERRPVLLLAGPWIVCAMGFAAYGLVTAFPLLGRHLLFALPAVFVLVAAGLSVRSSVEWVGAGAAVSLVALLALAGIALDHRYDKDDFRGLATVLGRCQLTSGNTVVAGPVDGVSYYDGSFTGADEYDARAAMDRVVGGESKAAVIDLNHTDPDGAISSPIARDHHLEVLDFADLRLVGRRSFRACSGR